MYNVDSRATRKKQKKKKKKKKRVACILKKGKKEIKPGVLQPMGSWRVGHESD